MGTEALQTVHADDIAKPYRPNFILAWLYRLFFSKIDVDPAWVGAVREASARGTVVYLMRSESYVDFIALDFFLKKFALPLIRFVTDLGLWILEPFRTGLWRLFTRREPEGPALQRAVSEGFSALLFMRKPQARTALKRRGDRADVDHVRVLIEQQRRQTRPILLMPQVFIWGKRPDSLYKGVVDQIFGPQEYPGRVRVFAQLLLHYGNARLRACEPLDLKQMLEENQHLDDAALVNKIHWLIITRLDRERRVVLGPVAKGPDRLKQEILRNPRIRAAIDDTARREKKDVAAVERQTRREIERLEARLNPVVLAWAGRALDWVFSRIYQGIEIDREGLQRIREQARKGPVVLLPSHKSHLDYLLISYVFYREGLQLPLIAAGDNLAFWPAGPILRRCGAFFIRRSFKGARLYTTLVDAYVRKILKEGYAVEFFPEGGRSRSGKLLPPKVGLLSMVADAADAVDTDVAYVPISIGYEKIVEQRSYVEELSGAEKKKEDAGALLTRAPRVLASKYGRAYVQIGEILHFSYSDGTRGENSLPPPEPVAEGTQGRSAKRAALDRMAARRNEIAALARRVTYEINRVTPVTPTALVATVLLGVGRRGIARDELLARVDELVGELKHAGAQFASSLAVAYTGGRRPFRVDAIDQAISIFVDASLLQVHGPASEAIYQVPDDKRLALDFYKNNLIHFFVPRSLVALAALAASREPGGMALSALREEVARLAELFKHEFQFRSERDTGFEQALARMSERGELVVEGVGEQALVRIPDREAEDRLRFDAGIVRNFVESYRVAARALAGLRKGSVPARELQRKTMALGERMYLTGEILQREAVSKPNIDNAFTAFREAGYLLGGEGGPQRLASGYDTVEALEAIEARFTQYLA
jgi:glycerol-3-phosphate O-acyltransferase